MGIQIIKYNRTESFVVRVMVDGQAFHEHFNYGWNRRLERRMTPTECHQISLHARTRFQYWNDLKFRAARRRVFKAIPLHMGNMPWHTDVRGIKLDLGTKRSPTGKWVYAPRYTVNVAEGRQIIDIKKEGFDNAWELALDTWGFFKDAPLSEVKKLMTRKPAYEQIDDLRVYHQDKFGLQLQQWNIA